MNISQYLTLSYLHKLLISNAFSVGLVGISILLIFKLNLAIIMTTLLAILAVLFSFYILYVLYLHGKKGWIYGFFIGLAVSSFPLIIFSNETMFLVAAKFLPLLFFIVYCISLKIKVGEWLLTQKYADKTFE